MLQSIWSASNVETNMNNPKYQIRKPPVSFATQNIYSFQFLILFSKMVKTKALKLLKHDEWLDRIFETLLIQSRAKNNI